MPGDRLSCFQWVSEGKEHLSFYFVFYILYLVIKTMAGMILKLSKSMITETLKFEISLWLDIWSVFINDPHVYRYNVLPMLLRMTFLSMWLKTSTA